MREKIRTPDTLVRSQVLYPAELHTRIAYRLSAVGVTGFEPDAQTKMETPRCYRELDL